MKSLVMKEAWVMAKRAANLQGGTSKEWLAWALTRAWKKAKEGKLVEETQVVESAPVLKGGMTEKQENFIASLLRKKVSNNPIAQAFAISSLRSTITKQQASELISELLSA